MILSAAFLGIGVKDGHMLDVPLQRLRAEGHAVEMHCYDDVSLDENLDVLADFLSAVPGFHFMMIRVHGDVSHFRHFEEFRRVLEGSECSQILVCTEFDTTEKYRYLFRQGDGDYDAVRRFQEIGGDDNLYANLVWALNTFAGTSLKIPDAVIPPAQGVYIPGRGMETLDEHMPSVGRSGRPVVAMLFHQKYWLTHNTDATDELYRCIEAQGSECLAIFLVTTENKISGAIGIDRVIDEYLMRDGRPVVDCVVNTMGFQQTLIANPGQGEQVAVDNFFARLGVPVLQAVSLYEPPEKWRNSPFGYNAADIAMSVVNPEFDGQIDTVPFGGSSMDSSGIYRQRPIADRCRMIGETAYNWARLRHIPEGEKRIAVLVYMYPPRQDLAAGGYGLDTMESVCSLLRAMKDRGYSLEWVPENGREVADRLLRGVTNDDQQMSECQIREEAVDLVTQGQYQKWFSEVHPEVRRRWTASWGEPPGDIHVLDGNILLPGIMNGNVFIGFQPDRGKCSPSAYHDSDNSPPHQYLGFYRWLKETWKADGIVHVGTHGTLEWLPGKSAGLSEECDPDVVLGNLPNVNPYIIDNPGEGMQAKRRQYCVITTHNIPAMTRSGGYAETDELESQVQHYYDAQEYMQTEKLPLISEKVLEICRDMNLLKDLALPDDCDARMISERMDDIYDYILEIKDAMIKDGLHILGEVPEGDLLAETVYSLVRYRNDEVPSVREAIASAEGLDMEKLLKDPSGRLPDGRLYGEAADSIDAKQMELIRAVIGTGFDQGRSEEIAERMFPGNGDILCTVRFVCGFLADALARTTDEIGNVVRALDGGFVPPGPSGCPGRGRARILPTGRNFYSLDPDGIPWHTSWKIGSDMAEQMVSRYIEDNGTYPRSVGVILWQTDVMKTGGDDVAYIFRLLGLRPVWTGYGGRVKGLEIIPLKELGRPRIDVTVRISGLFRDTFPNLTRLIDDGVAMVGALDEDEDSNYLAANLRRDTVEAIAKGIPVDKARRDASVRIFGDAPGQYGCGISAAIEKGDWKTVGDLGRTYVEYGCYIYGRGLSGEMEPELFRKRLGSLDVTVKNHNTRAVDMLDIDDDFDMLGGMNAAVASLKGEAPVSYMGDSSDTDNLRLRTALEECRFVFRSKVDNPKWTEGLMRHGFSGASELSKLFDYTLGWSATSDIIENWMYDDLAERFVLDENVREWAKDENPYAMMDMLARLEEAQERGFWERSPEMRDRLRQVYMEFEERIEEITDR